MRKSAVLFLITALFSFMSVAQAEIVTKAIEYYDGETLLEGYYAAPKTVKKLADTGANEFYSLDLGKVPGIIVVHEWTGLGDYAKKRAEQLAELGFAAFAVDMYGKGVYADDHKEAAELSGAHREDRNLMRRRVKSGLDVLLAQPEVDKDRIAAIGYCFGGTTVLEMARAGMDVDAVVSFHGALGTPMPAAPGTIKAKVAAMHGALDGFAKPGMVEEFEKEMTDAGADWFVVTFGGAAHSFTVPDAGDDVASGRAYNEDADKRSWIMMLSLFNEVF